MHTTTPPPFTTRLFRTPVMAALVALIASISFVSTPTPAHAATVTVAQNGIRYTADNTNVPAGATIADYDPSAGANVVIPDTVTITGTTYPVTTIGYEAFANNQLASVTIPDSVTTISDSAFANNLLASVTIPNSVTTIGSYAFALNPMLAEVWFTGPSPVFAGVGSTWLGDTAMVAVYYPKAHESLNGSSGYTTPVWNGYQTFPYFRVSFDANGGAGTMALQMNPAIATTITPNSFTRPGHTFAGWNTKTNNTGTSYKDGDVYGSALPSDLTLYAQWDSVSYDISFDLGGGVAGNPATYTITSNPTTLTNPTRNGYTFAGWTGTGLTGPTTSVTIATGSIGNRTYTATWVANDYTITYVLDGGVAGTPANPAMYTITSNGLTLNTPTRPGYTFTGWTGTGLTGPTASVTIATGSSGNRTYAATWDLTPAKDPSGTTPPKAPTTAPTPEGLAKTGSDSAWGLLAGVAALLGGAAVTILNTRRRNS